MTVLTTVYQVSVIFIAFLMLFSIVGYTILAIFGKAPELESEKKDKLYKEIREIRGCLDFMCEVLTELPEGQAVVDRHPEIHNEDVDEEECRKLGLVAFLEARRICAKFHNPEGVVFCDEQRPEGFKEDKPDEV